MQDLFNGSFLFRRNNQFNACNLYIWIWYTLRISLINTIKHSTVSVQNTRLIKNYRCCTPYSVTRGVKDIFKSINQTLYYRLYLCSSNYVWLLLLICCCCCCCLEYTCTGQENHCGIFFFVRLVFLLPFFIQRSYGRWKG